MAVRLSRATGNWLTAGTWGLVDSTSYNNSESTTTALTTSYQASSGATTGVITCDGVALKLSVRTGTTGTISVHLAIAGVEVTGTLVTINTADLPVAATADINGGWIFFKFASPVTLVGATSYTVEAKTSSSSQVSLFSTSGTNWARALVTTTTGAPAAGDDVIVCGEYLSAGSSNSFTVTMNETATTDYGAASTSLVTPSLAICSKGTLSYGVAASTNYYLRQSGNVIIYTGGTFNIGTVGFEIPRNSSASLNFDCGANVDFGLTVRNLGTFNANGLSRTSGKDIYYCRLNTDEAIASTSLGVDTDTGWLDNDVIAVASTTRTSTQCENGTMNGAANSSDLPVDGFGGAGGGLAFAHSGTSPTQAEVILLTRNVLIFGASSSLQGYVDIAATAAVAVKWSEFKWLGSATANKTGISVATTTGSCSFRYCSLHDFVVASSQGFGCNATSGNGFTFSFNVTYNIHSRHFQVSATSNVSWVADSNVCMKSVNALPLFQISDVGGTVTNNVACGSVGSGFDFTEASGAVLTISNNSSHSNGASGATFGSVLISGTITNFTAWRNTSSGISLGGGELTFSGLVCFGNTTSNVITAQMPGRIVMISPVLSGDTTFATTNGLALNSGVGELVVINGDLGTVTGIKAAHTNDILLVPNLFRIFLYNTKLASATEVSAQTSMSPASFISSQKHDQTAGLHKTWKRYGTLTIETTTAHTGSQSLKMTPNNASFKLESGSFFVPVANGATLTPTVYVREDASYVSSRARLILKRNDAIGVSADTVIATATASSDGAWEAISGTTISATDDGVMEFVIDCDGTAGNLFVDSFSVA